MRLKDDVMLKVALTGNIASGKSLVAAVWSETGVPLIRADDLAREVVAMGSVGLQRVVEAFGPRVLQDDGSLDRAYLRDRVFRDADERIRLEAILHPLIGALRDERAQSMENSGELLGVAEIPLLFEAGLDEEYGVVVLVVASDEERLRRLVEDRGLHREEAVRMMESQMPAVEKLSRADYVLDNGGTKEDLRIRALALLDLLRARARQGTGR